MTKLRRWEVEKLGTASAGSRSDGFAELHNFITS
jgi:hypothetical protein